MVLQESMALLPASPPPSAKRPIKTALHQAVLDCRLHQVRLLVAKHGVNVDSKDLNGRTPIMLASFIEEEFGQKMVKIFLKAGAYLNLRDNMGRTALSYACMNGRERIAALIVREDVLDINEPDNDGNGPLHHAATSGNPNIVSLLVECFSKFGLDVDTRNKLGYTPLLLACKNGHYVSAHTLLTKGKASPSLRDNEAFLNATEWTQRANGMHVKFGQKRNINPHSEPTLSFSREQTMYQRSTTPICRHVKNPAHPLSKSAQSRLPSIGNHSDLQRSETFIDGKEARAEILNLIDDSESQTPRLFKGRRRFFHPSTAKLLALNQRSKPTTVPDMPLLFKIYCDQYQPDWRKISNKGKNQVDISSSSSQASDLPAIEINS